MTPVRGDEWQPSGIVTLLSDFGSSDAYAGIMRGVIMNIAPQARLVDLTHEVPPQSVAAGALLLRSAVEYFPDGTVHLAVVDPGVGSDRAPIVAITERAVLVGPDNGLLQPSWEVLGLREIRRIAADELFLKPVSRTFHGRDIFAPIAGHLAAGRAPASVGPRLENAQSLAAPGFAGAVSADQRGEVVGSVLHVDRFGNLISNIAAAGLEDVWVDVAGRRIAGLSASYSDAPLGEIVVLEGSWGTVEIACNGGSAALALGCGVGAALTLCRRSG